MKRTRVAQFVARLTAWREIQPGFRNMPILSFEREISIEDAKRVFGFTAHPNAIGVKVGYITYPQMEVSIDPSVFEYAGRLTELCQLLSGVHPTGAASPVPGPCAPRDLESGPPD